MSDDLDTVASLRKRDREHDEVGDLMTILAVLFLTGQGSSARFLTRKIQRAAAGPMGSTMMGYYNYGDRQTFLYNFRMTKDQLEGGHRLVERQSDRSLSVSRKAIRSEIKCVKQYHMPLFLVACQSAKEMANSKPWQCTVPTVFEKKTRGLTTPGHEA